jgi:serine/threonine-protein kinase
MAEVAQTLVSSASRSVPAPVPEQQQPSIAVLPFANMSGDKENEYFSDGLAEEILNALAKIPGLKVIARTSSFAFRGKEQDITKIAETLRVRSILEGSVRRAGSRVRVTAQLIDAADASHLWSERYDRELADVFAVQDEIAQAIASALHVKLGGAPALPEQYKPSLPAYEALMKARYYIGHFRPDMLPRVKECFEQAIALDPNYALAHSEFGFYYMLLAILGVAPANLALPLVRAHAQKALELDPSLPEGHAMLGVADAYLDYSWKEAEARFRQAMARPPVSPLVRFLYAVAYLTPTGRTDDALQQLELALQEDPLNATTLLNRAICLVASGRYDDAIQRFREMLDLNPENAPAHGYFATDCLIRGELALARSHMERGYSATPLVPYAIGGMAGVLARTGDTARAEELIGKLQPDAFGTPRALAIYSWFLGDLDATAAWMEKAIDQRDPSIPGMLRQWYGRDLRHTPHWARLMRRLNLPEA